MVKEMRRKESQDFLNQAEHFLNWAKKAYDEGETNISTFLAIQSMINANDALTIFFIGKRGSSNHNEALNLHSDVVRKINDGSQRSRLAESLKMRNKAGYMGECLSKNDSESALRSAVIFFEWVKRVINGFNPLSDS